ncbi:metal ABC transporter substrate-binding protein [Beijerinckia sp. L45]|uniref:metal ABC transporter substrate-binding protein n=1 Tax=Beijerinckia sp. L45 TaxID=1641855 RepID=UPI00131C219C|nr:metal ABC transporter substrate-binding protein [Beijerinckia sp. L45]
MTFALTLAVAGCAAMTAPAEAKSLKAVASFTILADMVRNVGGDKVDVRSLVGPNGDPHTYEPTPDDARALKAADVVFVNGLGLEGWMDRLIAASGYKGTPVVASQGVAPLKMEDDGKTVIDPHAWNSAANGVIYVRDIAKALAAADPEDKDVFEKNAVAYEAKLAALDADARSSLAAVPQQRRKILTTHDALGYFAKAYDVEILAPLRISTEQEPSAATVAALITQITKEGIKTYFFENSNDPRLIEQIARATGAKPGGELYVESLSKPDGPAATYADMFRNNVGLITKAMRDQS